MEVMQASLWNFSHLQVLLPSSVAVPEGYIGNEALVCFILATDPVRSVYLNLYCQGFGQGVLLMLVKQKNLALVTFACQL